MLFIFIIGLIFYIKNSPSAIQKEGLENNLNLTPTNPARCPNMLIKKGSRFYLYNSKLAKVPGVNPVEFDNLEDYSVFLDWQKANNIHCPVLYLQQSINAQGESVYQMRPGSVTEPRGGIPPMKSMPNMPAPSQYTLLTDATRNDPPYNQNSYPAYDQTGQNIGQITPLDELNYKDENPLYPSPNPMDPNWGGPDFTQSLIDKGVYKGNEVEIAVA